MILVDAIRSQWKETLTWLVFTLVGGLLPLWGGWILITLFSREPEVGNFADNGEFALYSAALVAPLLYFVIKEYKTSPFAYRPVLLPAVIFLLLVSALLFAGVNSASAAGILEKIDRPFLRRWSLVTLLVSIVISFVVTVIDNYSVTKDYEQISGGQYRDLKKEFEALDNKEDE